METIAERLQTLRKAKGWPQWELAQRVEMTQSGYAMIESPKYGRHLTLAQASRLSLVLGCTLDWLALGKVQHSEDYLRSERAARSAE